MTSQLLQQLISRYNDGIATPHERQQLEIYWQQSLADDSVLKTQLPDERRDLELRMYEAALRQIQQQEPGAFRPVRALRSTRWFRPFAVAASVAGLILISTLGWFWYRQNNPLEIAYKTDYGQKKRVVLPEGSVVWLNGHSSLRYAVDKAGNRQAWLTGEGLFSVKHTVTHRTFVVHTTNQLTIEVLGTVFNVTNRRGSVNVVLRSGSVRIKDPTHQQPDVLLKPDEMVSQISTQTQLAKQPIRAEPRLAWTDGRMYVENKPLGELFDWIEDTYGLKVESSAALRAETFAGNVPTDSIDSFFVIIAKLYQVRVQQDGKTYRLN